MRRQGLSKPGACWSAPANSCSAVTIQTDERGFQGFAINSSSESRDAAQDRAKGSHRQRCSLTNSGSAVRAPIGALMNANSSSRKRLLLPCRKAGAAAIPDHSHDGDFIAQTIDRQQVSGQPFLVRIFGAGLDGGGRLVGG